MAERPRIPMRGTRTTTTRETEGPRIPPSRTTQGGVPMRQAKPLPPVVNYRERMKEALATRTEESFARRDEGGFSKSYFKKEIEIPQWKCKNGEHLIDIIPYTVGKCDPRIKEGDIAYVLDVWIHTNVGPAEKNMICPARNYGKPCPICEDIQVIRRQDDYDEDLMKTLYPRRRNVYNIVCLDDDKEYQKGVQIFEVANYFMEKHLSSLARKPKTGGFIPFSDPDTGKSVSFERKGSSTSTEFIAHKFVDRDGPIPDEILYNTFVLDELLHIPSYEEIAEAYFGGKTNGRKDSEEIGPEETFTDDSGSESEVEGESAGDCPHGGTFGKTVGQLEACDQCELWDDCARSSLESEESPDKKEPVPSGPPPVSRGKTTSTQTAQSRLSRFKK